MWLIVERQSLPLPWVMGVYETYKEARSALTNANRDKFLKDSFRLFKPTMQKDGKLSKWYQDFYDFRNYSYILED